MSDATLIEVWPVLHLAAALTSAGTAIASAEWLVPASKLAPHGILLAGSRGGHWVGWWLGGGVRMAILLRLILCLMFLACFALGEAGSTPAAVAIVGAALLTLPLRLSEPIGIWTGMNGAEHVLTANLVALALAYAAGTGLAAEAAVIFVALRALIEYGAAGWIKLMRARRWIPGSNLSLVLQSPDYGDPRLAHALARFPRLAGLVSVLVIGLEILVPLAVILPFPWAEMLLLTALAFHLGVALTMGLNTFLWAFVATYPPIIYCRDLLLAWSTTLFA